VLYSSTMMSPTTMSRRLAKQVRISSMSGRPR
jgi:hypothetical protein